MLSAFGTKHSARQPLTCSSSTLGQEFGCHYLRFPPGLPNKFREVRHAARSPTFTYFRIPYLCTTSPLAVISLLPPLCTVYTHSLGPQTLISYRGGPGWNVRFVVDKVTLRYAFIGVLRFSPVIIIPSLLQPALCNSATDRRYMTLVYILLFFYGLIRSSIVYLLAYVPFHNFTVPHIAQCLNC